MYSSRNGVRDDTTKVAVILTDGNSNNVEETLQEAYEAKKEGIHIITIAVGKSFNEDELETVSSYPAEVNARAVQRFEDLSDIITDIQELLCNSKYTYVQIVYTHTRMRAYTHHSKYEYGYL